MNLDIIELVKLEVLNKLEVFSNEDRLVLFGQYNIYFDSHFSSLFSMLVLFE
jgi:hypothetical protein